MADTTTPCTAVRVERQLLQRAKKPLDTDASHVNVDGSLHFDLATFAKFATLYQTDEQKVAADRVTAIRLIHVQLAAAEP